ncbi:MULTISPECIES: phage GP46 family protein [unclassified Serratia (in: enterobacteria)]|uniref:phage GP46 family protein n=1 Tax=unclassified Serratia (in: enterobacteria) TaxID=2647522 RepID=UPI0021186D3B|nr:MULTISPECIES: phage GP46 family protein [unclassified Serratia (in: enterobacteria)]
MSDISSFWDVERLAADWREGRGDLVSGDDLQTAIIISLFTDRVARDDDDIDGDDRRGWWGDADEENDIGSRLWLLRRQKLTQAVAQKAEDYSREALQWLVTDGVVSSFSVATQIVYPRRLNMVIRYQRPGNSNDTDMRFFWVWEQ